MDWLLTFLGLLTIVALLAAPVLIVFWTWRLLRSVRRAWLLADAAAARRRLTIMAAGAVIVCAPALAYSAYSRQFDLARVPDPLEIASVEFRSEKSWGFGPGGNETGFVVYRLKKPSMLWAQSKGELLAEALPGGRSVWRVTPTSQPASLDEHLGQYGFFIPVPESWSDQGDLAMQRPGSVYSFGGGGSLTIVDPTQGRIFYAYAG